MLFVLISSHSALAQYARPEGVRGMPRVHEYQQQILGWWGKLTEKDFEVENPKLNVVEATAPDELMRLWILALDVPRIGNKRSAPSTYMGADQFLLSHVESPTDEKVIRPGVWAEPITWLANFDDKNNPYFKSRALKLRAFVVAAQDMMMIDEQHELPSPTPVFRRADWLGPRVVFWAYVYRGTRDVIPDEVRQAYESALKKMIARGAKWGPKGEETFFDISLVTGMVIAAKTLNDSATTKIVEAYAKRFFMPGDFYNPAGYFADQGCYDTGFNGLSLYFATWAAAESDWPWMKEAVAQSWKLRGHLQLPEPDHKPHSIHGTVCTLISPTHTTLRTASHVVDDQWSWSYRNATAAYLTDEALCQVRWPRDPKFAGSTQAAYAGIGHDLGETGKILEKKRKDVPYQSSPWRYQLWPEHQNFPMQNYGYDCYPKGFFKHYSDVRQKNPELFKLPFDRDAAFTERFGDAYLIAKTPGCYTTPKPGSFGVVVHTGPVGAYPGNELLEFPNAPYGLGGGTLSSFWTPTGGSFILGSRGGMFAPSGQPKIFDDPEKWRDWPVHAVIGTVDGKSFFTSARIAKPTSTYDVLKDRATVKVGGVIPAEPLNQGPTALKGKLELARTFTYVPEGLKVETTVTGDGADSIAELYEAIPVFHRDGSPQPANSGTTIEFQTGGNWINAFTPPPPPAPKGARPATQPATKPGLSGASGPASSAPTPSYVEKVTAIRLARYGGAVVITFDKPRRVKLSPAEAVGGFLSNHVSRNVLVDLLDNKDQPASVNEPRSVAYTIAPVTK